MRTSVRRILLAVIIVSLQFAGCKKYPEGPVLSIRSKKARLAGDWQLERIFKNGVDSTAYYKDYLGSNYMLSIKKHNVYWLMGNFPGDGTWRLDDKKEIIYFKPTLASAPEVAYEIRRLKNRELWLRHTGDNGSVTDSHYFQ